MTSQAAFGPPFFPFVAALLLAGCATERAYEGPPLAADQRAIVRSDPVVSAGAPLQVRLRQVDGRDVGLTASGARTFGGRRGAGSLPGTKVRIAFSPARAT